MIGQTVAHYRIVEKIGEGGMGVVYRARDTRLGRDVALKFLSVDFTGSEELKERFIQEAQSASVLDHPNICTIHAIEETDDGRLFIAMGYYPGQTLKAKLREGAIPWQDVTNLAVQIAAGLQAAHEHGIIHMDVKPANLLVTPEGTVKILDFGLSRFTSEIDRTRPQGPLMGTVAYMPPEQVQGEKTGPESDIWALGVVLYELATGTRPFQGKNDMAVLYSIVHKDAEPPIEREPGLPVDFDKVIRRTLVKDRRYRYSNITELLADLEPLQQGSQSGTDTVPWVSGQAWKHQRTVQRSMVGFAVLVLVLLFALAWSTIDRDRDPPGPDSLSVPGVLLVEFQSQSEGAALDWLGPALGPMLVAELPANGSLKWIFEEDQSAEWTVGGVYRILGDGLDAQIEIDLLVQNMKSGELREPPTVRGGLSELPELNARLATHVASILDLPPLSLDSTTELAPRPRGPDTARRLAQAQEKLRLREGKAAVEILRQALESKPDDALLHLTLSKALGQLIHDQDAQQESARAMMAAQTLSRRERLYYLAWDLEVRGRLLPATALLRWLWLAEGCVSGEDPVSAEDVVRIDRGLHLASALARTKQMEAAFGILDPLRPLLSDDPRVPLVEIEIRRGESREREQEAAARAIELARRLDAPLLLARGLLFEGQAWIWIGEPKKATDKLEAALDIYTREGYKAGEAQVLNVMGGLQWNQQDYLKARSSFDRAGRLYGEIGSRARQARILHNKAIMYMERGDFGAAEEILREALPRFVEAGHRDGQVMALLNLASVLVRIGQFDDSETAYQDALELLSSWSNPSFLSIVWQYFGELKIHQGRLAEARQLLTQALKIQREETGDQFLAAQTQVLLAQVLFHQGELGEALRTLEETLTVFEQDGSLIDYAQAHAYMGEILTYQGHLDRAAETFNVALDIQVKLSNPRPAARTRLDLAQLLQAKGRVAESTKLARQVLADLAQSRAVLEPTGAHVVLAINLVRQNDPDGAQQQIDRARRLLDGIDSPFYHLPLDIAAARVRRAQGDIAGARDQLQTLLASATTLGFLGSKLEIELAMGEIALGTGTGQTGRIRLRELAQEARRLGYGLLATRAEKATERPQGQT